MCSENVRVCPECGGEGIVTYESDPIPTPHGPHYRMWTDNCPVCGGDGEIEVFPIELEDLDQ